MNILMIDDFKDDIEDTHKILLPNSNFLEIENKIVENIHSDKKDNFLYISESTGDTSANDDYQAYLKALESLKRLKVDLILLDIRLRYTTSSTEIEAYNSFKIAKAILENDYFKNKDFKLIFTSRYMVNSAIMSEIESLQEKFKAHYIHYLEKPDYADDAGCITPKMCLDYSSIFISEDEQAIYDAYLNQDDLYKNGYLITSSECYKLRLDFIRKKT